jgi:hypothetical protein
MLDRAKVLTELTKTVSHACKKEHDERVKLRQVWHEFSGDRIDQQYPALHTQHPYTVIATDGSQIYPDRHRGTNWYLINVASIIIQYGELKSSIIYDSQPTLFTGLKQIATESINAQRSCMELRAGYALATAQAPARPLLMMDGPLAALFMEREDEQAYYKILQKCYEQKILVVGYTSLPQSNDLVKLLKHDFQEITDYEVVQLFLKPGCYSRSWAMPHKELPAHLQIQFLYFHNGYEIVRIEIPAYLLPEIDSLMAIIFDQCIKGMGYPVCLSEAHEQAVIKEADREYFYQLLEQQLQIQNKKLTSSHKSMKKRALPV